MPLLIVFPQAGIGCPTRHNPSCLPSTTARKSVHATVLAVEYDPLELLRFFGLSIGPMTLIADRAESPEAEIYRSTDATFINFELPFSG